MNDHRHTEIYRYSSGFWGLDQILNWNNGVVRDCNRSIVPVWPSQDKYLSQSQTPDALKWRLFSSGYPVATTSSTETEPVPLALPVQEPHVVLGGHPSSVTLGNGSEPSRVSSRFSTPSLTDGSTIVPPYSSSVTEEPAEGSCVWTSPSTHSNGSIRHRNQLSLTDPVRSRSLPIPYTTPGTKDQYICLYPQCEASFRGINELKRHVLKHIGLVFSCPIPGCIGRTFTTKYLLFVHARLMHRECPLTMFEAVALHSKLDPAFAVSQDRKSVHDIKPEASHGAFRVIKGDIDHFDLNCSESTSDILPSMPSQLNGTDPAPVDSAHTTADIAVKMEGLTQPTGPELVISADKDVSLGRLKSISLSLWPPQYLALLELGVIQKIDALLKSGPAQSETSDDTRVFYNRTDKSLRLTGNPQSVNDAKLIVLEGIESLASDTEARARQEIWSKHVVPDSKLQPCGKTTDTANAVMGNEAKVPMAANTKLKAFVLHKHGDDDLIKAWHDAVLPALDGLLSMTSDSSVVVTLQREGPNEVESRATIRVCSSMLMSEVEKVRLEDNLLSLLPDRLRNSCRVEFSRGSIRRSGSATRAVANGKYHPPICAPRNRRWLHKPTMGASIGRRGSQDDTATLGGYVLVDGIAHILTVHHLFEEERELAYSTGRLRKGQYRITQPSEQDIRDIGVDILSLRDRIGRFEAEQATLLEWMAQLKELEKLQTTIPGDERLWQFGEVIASSGYRNRAPRKAPNAQSLFGSGLGLPIEMDWAICSIPEDRVGLNEISVPENCPQDSTLSATPFADTARQHISNKVKQCTKICEPTGGVAVHSLGRTSHYQAGVVSPCGTYTRHSIASGGFRSSVEWTIVRPASKSLADWSEGGMGVDGDSGSWIVREDNNALMGMLWGRLQNEDVADPVALFTPIHDVFDDIIDTIRPMSLCLPQGAQAQPFTSESLSPYGTVAKFSNKRKTQAEMLPPSKRRDADSLAPPHRCRKCCPPPSIQLQMTPPGTPNSGGRYCGSPAKTCDCALEISPPATPAQ